MASAMDNFSLLLKPASADCNLRCRYCFYDDSGQRSAAPQQRRMSQATLQCVLQRYFATTQEIYSMTWQGGEPTLMGTDFYQRVTDWQKRLAPQGARVVNCLQTNATAVTPELADHLAHYRFLVGASLDGPAPVHDRFRKTRAGRPTHTRVVKGIRLLKNHGVPVNAVCLVSAANVRRPEDVYRYLTRQGLTHLQFIPCVEHDDQGKPLPWSITGTQWGAFLRRVFALWDTRDKRRVSVRNFESVLARLVTGEAVQCHMHHRCNQYLVVEYNGDVYPCDFFVGPEYCLGNLHDTSFEAMRTSEQYARFAAQKQAWPEACAQCAYLELCFGDCLKCRPTNHRGAPSLLCDGWRDFYAATLPRFKQLAASLNGK